MDQLWNAQVTPALILNLLVSFSLDKPWVSFSKLYYKILFFKLSFLLIRHESKPSSISAALTEF